MNDNEQVLWMLVYAAAINKGIDYPQSLADQAVISFRNSEVLYPPQPPEDWEDEDVPF